LSPAEFRAARAALGLTQSELAAALESKPRSVQHWEAGDRAIPGPVRVALRLMLDRPTKR
jgi:DNA-binding transcriptional regulator YiaG